MASGLITDDRSEADVSDAPRSGVPVLSPVVSMPTMVWSGEGGCSDGELEASPE
jgi:hypothetical protein